MQAAAVVAALQNEDSRMHPDSDRRAWPTWLGAPLIIAAGLVIAWREHRLSGPTLRDVARAEGT